MAVWISAEDGGTKRFCSGQMASFFGGRFSRGCLLIHLLNVIVGASLQDGQHDGKLCHILGVRDCGLRGEAVFGEQCGLYNGKQYWMMGGRSRMCLSICIFFLCLFTERAGGIDLRIFEKRLSKKESSDLVVYE